MPLPKTPEGIEAFKKKVGDLKRGVRASEETKQKLSASLKLYYSNPENIRKAKARALKQWSDPERRKARSELLYKRYKDPAERIKTGLSMKGRTVSEETRKKLSDIGKLHWQNPEVRKAARECKLGEKNPMFGKTPSPESIRKRVESRKWYTPSEETRKKLSASNKGRAGYGKGTKRHPDIGKKISEAKKGKSFTDDHCKKLSLARVGKFCGEKAYNWKGGISYEPYCPKFNKEFKERVRDFFGRKCVECGKSELKEKHHVHHVAFNKQSCCDNTPPLFVPLCGSCHAKTQFNREYWQQHFTDMITNYYGGQCYLQKK